MDKRRLPIPKVTYHCVKPKDEAEAREQQRRVDNTFDILFEAVDKDLKARGEKGLV